MKILINGPFGIREVDSSKPFHLELGEIVVGNDGAKGRSGAVAAVQELANMLGESVANTIEITAKSIGIPKCKTCTDRGLVLKHLGNIGVIEAYRLIKETYGRAKES